MAAIDHYDDKDIEACVEEVMEFNEEVNIDELKAELIPLKNPFIELKPLPFSPKYAFLGAQEAKLVIISSQLD